MHASTSKLELNGGEDYLVFREGSGDTIEIYDIAVNSERMKGYGRTLVEMLKLLYPTKTIWAITRKSNHGAQHFYEKLNFEVCSDLPRLYKDEDARMYILHR